MMKTLIIAEAGVNHNGDLELAKKLALTAKECGADIVKFQTAKLSAIVSKYACMADYQVENIGQKMSQKDMLERLILPFDAYKEIADYCKKIDIEFLSTPFDIDSVEFLQEIGCRFWKIPSGEITNLPYLEKIAETGKDIVMSTGMCTMHEIEAAMCVLREAGAGKIALLHCTTEYPAPFHEVNLKAMDALRDRFKCEVGYSDHTRGIEIPIAAVARGATIIEKHFTLSRNMEGPDHKASLEPDELKNMISAIRNVEIAMGDGIKRPTQSELKNRNVARKSIVARKDIRKGEILTEKNITTKRPGNGINPLLWKSVLGTLAIRDFKEDELIEI